MLTDAGAIAIMRSAQQERLRNPARPRQPFQNILDDFFVGVGFAGRRVFDVGPGQWDFGLMVRERGGLTVGIDKDEAVCTLADYFGFPCRPGDLGAPGILRDFGWAYDGVFCKFGINAFWFPDDAVHRAFVDDLAGLLKPDGWGWIAPWNGRTKSAGMDSERLLAVQAECFARHGFAAFDLAEPLAVRYGVHGNTDNRVLFVRNLRVPDALQALRLR